MTDISSIDGTTKRKMLVNAMRTVLKVLIETYTYEFANDIRRQGRVGAIGIELTGVSSDLRGMVGQEILQEEATLEAS